MSWTDWQRVEGEGFDFAELIYEKRSHDELEGRIARVSINRPQKYNAVTNKTVDEMWNDEGGSGERSAILHSAIRRINRC